MGLLSNSARAIGSPPSFQPSQIVCLEAENTRLYAEVVQLVAERQVCWVHPLVLIRSSMGPWENLDAPLALDPQGEGLEKCLDLRGCSDLLLPWMLFRAALDTEAMPILAYLYDPARSLNPEAAQANNQMHQLIRKVCKANPEAF